MNIDKKKSIILGIILIILVLGGLAFYQYSVSNVRIQEESNLLNNDTNQQNIDQDDNDTSSDNQIQLEGVEGISSGEQGGLIVCVYKCGDGICQRSDDSCKDNLNCVCTETNLDCPQDCTN